MNYWQESKDNIYVAGHRGWPARFPENTMESFLAAVALGVDQIETDVRITKDGELVCIHDAAVDRTTDGTGLVCEKTLAELRQLDAGKIRGMTGYKIPTFREFMDEMTKFPLLTLDIELKEYPTEGHEEVAYSVCDRVLKMVDDYGFTDRVVINTFSGKLQEYIEDHYGKKYRRHTYYPINHLKTVVRDPYTASAYCCCMFKTEDGELMASREECDAMAAKGIEPWAPASVKTAADVDTVIDRGAVLITCNNPDEILHYLRVKGKHI